MTTNRKAYSEMFLSRGLDRISEIGDFALKNNLKILVDGEYTYMNPGISAIALGMMMKYNKLKPVVANTYQCYLKVNINPKSFRNFLNGMLFRQLLILFKSKSQLLRVNRGSLLQKL